MNEDILNEWKNEIKWMKVQERNEWKKEIKEKKANKNMELLYNTMNEPMSTSKKMHE